MAIEAERNVTIEFAATTDAFKANPQATAAEVLRRIADLIETGHVTGEMVDPEGVRMEGFWQATLSEPLTEDEKWLRRYEEFVVNAYESGENTREINECYQRAFPDFPTDEIDGDLDYGLTDASLVKLVERDVARGGRRVVLRDLFLREMEEEFEASTFEAYINTFGR